MTEGSISSASLNSTELLQAEVMVSPEDVAWADSCLSKDPDLSDNGWTSLKDALLETLRSSQSHSSPHQSNNSPETAKMEILSSQDTGDVPNLDKVSFSTATTSEVAEAKNDDSVNPETADDFWSTHKMEDVFLPTYNENLRDIGVSDPEIDLVFQAFELEETNEVIFKIWDLGIPSEEDDLVKQLNKALAESSLEPASSVSDDSKTLEGLQDESIDDLISGIADLTLDKLTTNSLFVSSSGSK